MSNFNQAQLLRENLRILVRTLGILDREEASCCGLTLSQSYTIVEIGRAGTISVNLLTEILGVDKSTVSKSVDKLVNNGVLVRETDPEDRRSVLLRLTDKGQAFFGEIEKRSTAYFEDVAAALPGDRREQIVEGLECLVQVLKGSRCC